MLYFQNLQASYFKIRTLRKCLGYQWCPHLYDEESEDHLLREFSENVVQAQVRKSNRDAYGGRRVGRGAAHQGGRLMKRFREREEEHQGLRTFRIFSRTV